MKTTEKIESVDMGVPALPPTQETLDAKYAAIEEQRLADVAEIAAGRVARANEAAKPRFDLIKARADVRSAFLGAYARYAKAGKLPDHVDTRNMLDGKPVAALSKVAKTEKDKKTLAVIDAYRFLFLAENGGESASYLLGVLLGK